MADCNDLNVHRGLGESARIQIDNDKLKAIGWDIKRRESVSKGQVKVFFTYVSPSGKTVKSAKEVEERLKHEGTFESVLLRDERTDDGNSEGHAGLLSSSEESDCDYEPPPKEAKHSTNNDGSE